MGWTPSCAPRQDVRRWSPFVVTRCTRESPERRAYMRRRRRPSRQDGRRLTRDSEGSPRCARGGSRRSTRHTQDQNSTPPLEALKVVLSEAVTSKREEEVVALADVRRASFDAPARRCAGCCSAACPARATPHKIGRKSLPSTLSDLESTRGIACPCVWQGCTKGEDVVATVHGDDITIGDRRWNYSSK